MLYGTAKGSLDLFPSFTKVLRNNNREVMSPQSASLKRDAWSSDEELPAWRRTDL